MFKNIMTSGLLGAAMLLGATACTDDHFDILADGTAGSNSLWENIQSSGQTDSLALILNRTIVMKSETDKSGKITYAEMLNQPQSFTFWAPKDGTYNAKHYLDMLDQRDDLLAKSTSTDSEENDAAWRLNWTVANQLVQNHLARFNYADNSSLQKVRLLNAKVSYYDPAGLTFNNVAMDGEAIPSSNGTMHLLEGVSPFAYNIYDYIVYHDEFSKLWGVLSDPAIDKRVFSETASTEGAMNENGEMVYVDSVFYHTNEILDASGALLSNEDSLYVALLPTDEAWDKAYETVSNLYRYGSRYAYEWNDDQGKFMQTAQFNTDSLQAYNANRTLIQSSFFTTSRFSVPNQTDSAQVNAYAQTADSLLSTNYTVFYNPNQGGLNPNFNGQAPVKASNGYIYAVDSYNVNPGYTWIQRNEIKLSSDYFVAYVSGATSDKGQLITLTEETRCDTIYGDLEDNMYRRFEKLGNSDMNVFIRLSGLYSGKYKISAEIVPTQINMSFPANENEHAVFNYELQDDEGNKIGSTVNDFETKSDSVRTYTLFESIEIPKCYVSLPSDYSNSFVRLRFQMTARHSRANAGNCKSLNISKIIVEPVREETL
ncbi:MAG: hypothetical protein J6N92_03265 [Alloprevotella sp.]|nr:hypothetical protein [Alloprevotella sp.]